jgi:uncharacterized lipoprotein YajG
MRIQRATPVFLDLSVLFLASCGRSQGTQALATSSVAMSSGPLTHVATATINVRSRSPTPNRPT